ncbi:MAG: hypothetical protein OXC99_11350 [Chloroflexi bacterium]|nr:hypothetical protein [Chloroflexota bacterium]
MVGKYTWIPNPSLPSAFTSRKLHDDLEDTLANAVDYVYMLDNVLDLISSELAKRPGRLSKAELQDLSYVQQTMEPTMRQLINMQMALETHLSQILARRAKYSRKSPHAC